MGNIGRLIPDEDWPHSADWNSIWFALSGLGYIMPVGGRCEPSKTSALEVTVSDGQISVGLPDVHSFSGGNVELSSNGESSYPRYDLIYLEYDDVSGNVSLKIEEGTPEEHPKHPDLPLPPNRKVVPVAVVFFEALATEITSVKDSRTVMGPTHQHTDGEGLDLSPEGVMKVSTDEETVTTEGGVLGLAGGGVSWSDFDFSMGDGLEGVDTDSDTVVDTLQVSLKQTGGLVFDSGEVKVDPSVFRGEGLEMDGNNDLQVAVEDGLKLSNERLKLDIGDGLVLDGTTPDRILKVDTVDGGGLQFDNGDLEVDPSDFYGGGLGVNTLNDLTVDTGDGITLYSGAVKADISLDHGLELATVGTNTDKQICVDLETDGGLSFTSSGGNIKVNPADFDGDGLQNSATDRLELNAGNLDGKGITTDGSNNLALDVSGFNGHGISSDSYNNLYLEYTDFSGAGIGVNTDNDMEVRAGDGVQILNDRVAISPGTGLKFDYDGYSTPDKPLRLDLYENGDLRMGGTDGDELAIHCGDLAGYGLTDDGSDNLEIYDGNGIEFSSGLVRIDVSDIAGSGLGTDSDQLKVKVGDGLAIDGDDITVSEGDGLTSDSAGLHLSLGSGLKFDGSRDATVDNLDGGGIDFQTGSLMVEDSDLFEVVLNQQGSTILGDSYWIPDTDPLFVMFRLTDDRATGVDSQKGTWYFEEYDSGHMNIIIDNLTGDEEMSYHVKVYKMG